MESNPYLKPPTLYAARGCGKTITRLMMSLEHLKICSMFEYINKYRRISLPKVNLEGVISEYITRKKISQHRLKSLSSYERAIMTPWDLLEVDTNNLGKL